MWLMIDWLAYCRLSSIWIAIHPTKHLHSNVSFDYIDLHAALLCRHYHWQMAIDRWNQYWNWTVTKHRENGFSIRNHHSNGCWNSFPFLPLNRCYSRMEPFPHALRLASEYDLYWSFAYLATIFAYASHLRRHYNLHRSVAVPMAYSTTFDYNYHKMASNAIDWQLDSNNCKFLVNWMNPLWAVQTTSSLHNLHRFDPMNHSEGCCSNSGDAVVPVLSNGFRRVFYVKNCNRKKWIE